MKILNSQVYVGPNIYALFPVIRLTLDLGELEDWPTERLGRGFTDKLLEILPGLHQHGCSYGEPGGFVRRLSEDEGTWLGHVLEHVAIELQNVAGTPVTFGKTRGNGEPGQYHVVYEYGQADVGLEAGQLALLLLDSLLPPELRQPDGHEFDFARRRDRFIRFAQSKAFAPRSRRAFLATTPLAFGLGRMYEIYASLGDTSAPVRVFHDRAEALAWLNSDVPPEQVIE